MTIYSWNMLFTTRERNRAFEFIANTDFDIFCLQEVPNGFLPRLQELGCHIAYVAEGKRLPPYRPITIYSVILSRYPILNQQMIALPDYSDILRLWTKITLCLLRMIPFSKIQNRYGLYVDIQTPYGKIRVCNLHITLAHPARRAQEFDALFAHYDQNIPTIICGDFNILEKPHITILNWLFGGKVSDALSYRRERTHIEERFVEHSLTNALRGKVTHPLSQSQLDHILVSHEFVIKNAEVLKDRRGSDHHPIRVEVA